MSSWCNVRRRIIKKTPTCSPTLVCSALSQSALPLVGGASDSAIKMKLSKKASQAGVNHAQDLIQLVWSENAAALRQLWGSPTEIRVKLLGMAQNSTQILDPGKSSSSSSLAKQPKNAIDPLVQIAKFEQQTLQSELVTSTGVTLTKLQVSELGATSSGYILCHSATLVRARNATGAESSFGMVQQPTQQMQADHAVAVKKGLNLAAAAGSVNWVAVRSRPDISWAVFRAARLASRDPALAFHRLRHIAQFLRWTLDYGLKYVPLQNHQKTMWWA
eukprot:1335996-Amphidinium_carterae.4